MNLSEPTALSAKLSAPLWRRDAARIVEELFPVVSPDYWNELLDLRGLLLSGTDWPQALDLFLECRRHLEEDHYLPFYRLRMLLTGSLRLESGDLGRLLRRKHRSLESLKRAMNRERFEHAQEGLRFPLQITEA
jgi:hypothetical protein